ncbi:unnamed protein product [Amoebophrya sp. A120]|nr:unnamed protein product [Amoebophrya sp. A120]|eukprot:GSA120T00019473001.1
MKYTTAALLLLRNVYLRCGADRYPYHLYSHKTRGGGRQFVFNSPFSKTKMQSSFTAQGKKTSLGGNSAFSSGSSAAAASGAASFPERTAVPGGRPPFSGQEPGAVFGGAPPSVPKGVGSSTSPAVPFGGAFGAGFSFNNSAVFGQQNSFSSSAFARGNPATTSTFGQGFGFQQPAPQNFYTGTVQQSRNNAGQPEPLQQQQSSGSSGQFNKTSFNFASLNQMNFGGGQFASASAGAAALLAQQQKPEGMQNFPFQPQHPAVSSKTSTAKQKRRSSGASPRTPAKRYLRDGGVAGGAGPSKTRAKEEQQQDTATRQRNAEAAFEEFVTSRSAFRKKTAVVPPSIGCKEKLDADPRFLGTNCREIAGGGRGGGSTSISNAAAASSARLYHPGTAAGRFAKSREGIILAGATASAVDSESNKDYGLHSATSGFGGAARPRFLDGGGTTTHTTGENSNRAGAGGMTLSSRSVASDDPIEEFFEDLLENCSANEQPVTGSGDKHEYATTSTTLLSTSTSTTARLKMVRPWYALANRVRNEVEAELAEEEKQKLAVREAVIGLDKIKLDGIAEEKNTAGEVDFYADEHHHNFHGAAVDDDDDPVARTNAGGVEVVQGDKVPNGKNCPADPSSEATLESKLPLDAFSLAQIRQREIEKQQALLTSSSSSSQGDEAKKATPSPEQEVMTSSASKNTTKHLYVFANEKNAKYDKELQLKVIEEMSKNSAHRQHALILDAKSDELVKKKVQLASELKAELKNHPDNFVLNADSTTSSTSSHKQDYNKPAKIRRVEDLLLNQKLPRLQKFQREADSFLENFLKQNAMLERLLLDSSNTNSSTGAAGSGGGLVGKNNSSGTAAEKKFCAVMDMDMFYAAVEIRDALNDEANPTDLRERPVAVGGIGMIATSNYVARRYGVRSAMPGFIGKELCKRQNIGLHFVHPNMEKYKKVSEQVVEILKQFLSEDAIKVPSMDEFYLDLSHGAGVETLADASDLVRRIRGEIATQLHLTASAGISGQNFMLAKMGADVEKPNGQYAVPAEERKMLKWLRAQSVRKLSGVGKVTEKILNALELHKIQDLWTHRGLLFGTMTEKAAQFLVLASHGLPQVREEKPQQSISHESTFGGRNSSATDQNTTASNKEKLLEILEELAAETAKELIAKKKEAKCITVKIKRTNFQVEQRSKTLAEFTDAAEKIRETARALFLEKFFAPSLENSKAVSALTGLFAGGSSSTGGGAFLPAVGEKKLELRLLGVRASTLRDKI